MHEEVVSSTTSLYLYILMLRNNACRVYMHHVYVLTSSGRIISIETYPS